MIIDYGQKNISIDNLIFETLPKIQPTLPWYSARTWNVEWIQQ